MNVAYLKQIETSFFSDAKEQLETIINQLGSDDYEDVDHGCVETYINEQGNELLRRLFQGWLDKKAANEVQKSSISNVDGDRLSCIRKNTKRTLTTLFGPVKVGRISYGKSKSMSIFPADAELNLPQDQYSDGVRKRAAKEVIKSSFDNAVESIKETTGGSLPKRQCLNVTRNVAQDFESYYEQNRFEEPEESKGLLTLSFDGKGIVMRHDSLRECTKKSAKKNKKLNTRLSPGEKKDRKRMAQVAAVYTAQPHVRTPESIMKVQKDDNVLPFKSPIRNKRVWASVEREAESVIKEAFLEALQRDPLKQRQWIVLVDGLPHQIKLIKKVMMELDVSAAIVMDFIHVLEYLWNAAWCIYDKDDISVEDWVAKQAVKILNGECSQVAKGIRQTATKRGITNRENIDKCANYLLKNKQRLKYKEALQAGFPIATGVIEGACRHLINDRLDITGARWSLKGAEALLKLRSLKSSGDFYDYWHFHKQQEKLRNYPFLQNN
jgi:hypothetical protein